MTHGKKFFFSGGVVYCVRRHLARLQRHVKRFLIVFIFTSGVGNGLSKPVHRLCSVSAETVSNAPSALSEATTREAFANFDDRITRSTSNEVSHNPRSAQSVAVNTPKNRNAITRRALNKEDGVVSSAAVDSGTSRMSANRIKGEKETYGERLRRLSSQGNRDGNGTGDDYRMRNEFFQTGKVKSEAVYSPEAVERREKYGGIPKGNLSSDPSEPLPKGTRGLNEISTTRTALTEAVALRSDGGETVSTEADRSEILRGESQSKIINEDPPTKFSLSSEAEKKKAKDDTLRYETRQAFLKNVAQTWAVQTPQSTPVTSEGISPQIPLPSPPIETLQQYAKRVILPQIHIERMPFAEVLSIVDEAVKANATEGRTVNFILVDPKNTAPEINLSIRDLSLERVVHWLSEMTQFTVLYEGNSIIFRDPSLKQTLRTCIFPISRGSVLQILSYTDLHNSDEEKKLSEEERLKQFFQRIGIPMNDKNVGFAYDGSNLIVTHEELWLQRIEAILQQYRQCKQIAIEAKFLEVSQGVLDELGLKFDGGMQKGARVVANMSGGTLRKMTMMDGGMTDATTLTFPGDLDYGNWATNVLQATPVLNGYQMGVVLRAIEQHSDSDLMCTPKVTVLSGRRAEIVIADELRYPQGYRDAIANVGNDGRGSTAAGVAILGGAPENFTTRNIGIEMFVTPVAEHNGCIHLTLEPRVTRLSGFTTYGGSNVISSGSGTENYSSGFKQPTFATRKIRTELSIKSGSTVVMGGLTREEVKEMHDRIPLFGDIPIFGKLFQSKGKTSQKKNLLIFVTANLVDENGQYIVEPEFKVSKSL